MNLQSRSKEEPEINLTSLIDVVLLLLVFFMVSTSFVREAEINIRLPEARAEPVQVTDVETLEIGITETGKYFINGMELRVADRRNLRAGIEKIVGDNRDLNVIIRADAESDLQVAVTAMEVAGELGFSSVNIATANASQNR
jgi:biopolymer transport protein ExbD